MGSASTFVELHVSDFQQVLDFYGGLGFEVVWAEHDYLTMRLGQSTLCFYGGNEAVTSHSYFSNFPSDTKPGFAVEIIVFVDDLDANYERAKALGAVVGELRRRPWGVRDYRIADPFGFYLRISERYEIVERFDKIAETPSVLRNAGLQPKIGRAHV